MEEKRKSLKIAIAGFALESVSFLPTRVEKKDFDLLSVRGAAMIEALSGTASVGGGFIDIFQAEQIDIHPIVYVDCAAAGSASDEAYEAYRDEIIRGIEMQMDNLDGVLLYLHGAMTTPTRCDPETELLTAVRGITGPDLPIMVAFDLHGNLSLKTQALCTAFFGFHFSPHTDMAETGARAARTMVQTLRGEVSPITAMVKVPLVLPSIFTATDIAPLSELVALGFEAEKLHKSILDVSIFCGFAYADVPDIGFSVVVVSDRDEALANDIAQEIKEKISRQAGNLFHESEVVSVAGAMEASRYLADAKETPIVLLEHADRCNDSTWILQALLDQQGDLKVAVPYLWDPEAATLCHQAGVGKTVLLELGGHSSGRAGGPVSITAKVLWSGHKTYVGTGPMRAGRLIDLGMTAVVEVENIMVSITTFSTSAIDEDCFLQFGYVMEDFDLIVLRSKTHFRAVYEDRAQHILIVDTPDWGTADLTALPYKNIPDEISSVLA